MAVKIGDLAKAVMKELDDYGVAVGLEVEKVSKEVAEDTAKMLNKTSPKLTGDYAASWTYGTGETKRTKPKQNWTQVSKHLEKTSQPCRTWSRMLTRSKQDWRLT